MISTHALNELAAPERLREIARALAILDAIFAPDEDDRAFTYDASWARGVEVATIDYQEGDTLHLWFSKAGCVIRGFDPRCAARSEIDVRDVFAGLPKALDEARTEPAFGGEATFCIFRLAADKRYRTGKLPKSRAKDPDGSARLLAILDDHPSSFIDYAREVWERKAPMKLVEKLYDRKTLTDADVLGLNKDADVAAIFKEAKALGIPTSKGSPIKIKPRKAPKLSPGDHDAGFLVALDDGKVSLSFGGKPVASKRNPDLYDHLIDYVRRAIIETPAR